MLFNENETTEEDKHLCIVPGNMIFRVLDHCGDLELSTIALFSVGPPKLRKGARFMAFWTMSSSAAEIPSTFDPVLVWELRWGYIDNSILPRQYQLQGMGVESPIQLYVIVYIKLCRSQLQHLWNIVHVSQLLEKIAPKTKSRVWVSLVKPATVELAAATIESSFAEKYDDRNCWFTTCYSKSHTFGIVVALAIKGELFPQVFAWCIGDSEDWCVWWLSAGPRSYLFFCNRWI